MKLKDAYLEIVQRSIEAAEVTLSASLQEAASFHAYHAFESLGGALCASLGEEYSMEHTKKINQFVAIANRGMFRQHIGHGVSNVAMIISSIRNKCLYPQESNDEVISPNQFIDDTDVSDLLKRVKGICNKVNKHM